MFMFSRVFICWCVCACVSILFESGMNVRELIIHEKVLKTFEKNQQTLRKSTITHAQSS